MSWENFKRNFFAFDALNFSIDLSRVGFPAGYVAAAEPMLSAAFDAMEKLEKGAIANPDENRMVGHYWLRAPELAPTPELTAEIAGTLDRIEAFAKKIHAGEIRGSAGAFKNLLCIGIGGSALGPQFVSSALGMPGRDKMKVFFLDNTDADGFDVVFAELKGKLGETLCRRDVEIRQHAGAAQRDDRNRSAVRGGGARFREARRCRDGRGIAARQDG